MFFPQALFQAVCPQWHVEQHQWCRDTAIDPKWNNLLSQEFVCRLGATTGLILPACASLQHVCLPPQLWMWEAKASRRFQRWTGKDRVTLWQCRHLYWHCFQWGTLSRANACGCALAPGLLTGFLLGGDSFARMYWISSGTRSFLCTLSADKAHVSESIKAFLQGSLCASYSPVGKAGGRATSYRGKAALLSPHGPVSTEWGGVSHRTLTSPARQKWSRGFSWTVAGSVPEARQAKELPSSSPGHQDLQGDTPILGHAEQQLEETNFPLNFSLLPQA